MMNNILRRITNLEKKSRSKNGVLIFHHIDVYSDVYSKIILLVKIRMVKEHFIKMVFL